MVSEDYKFCNIFLANQVKQGLIFHVNPLHAEDSHEISSLIWTLKQRQSLKVSSAAKVLVVL